MKYELEKSIWTELDFDTMGWHDNNMYQFSLNQDLALDIDYIFKWNQPELEGMPFTFWIAPATLVFRQISNIKFELYTDSNDTFEIDSIEKSVTKDGTIWTIITRQGYIEFVSEGYTQYIRQAPSFQFEQYISYAERYGYTLERTTKQDNPNLIKEHIVNKRKQDLEHYENAKKRHLKQKELIELKNARAQHKITLKEYLLKKKEIKEMLYYYDYWLKATRFEDY